MFDDVILAFDILYMYGTDEPVQLDADNVILLMESFNFEIFPSFVDTLVVKLVTVDKSALLAKLLFRD